MCGLYGEIRLTGDRAPDPDIARRMGAAIVHRGPDDDGLYADDTIAFGLRRLSIIDLAGGHQPIANEDGTVLVACNGEIYNFRQLRQQLLAAGHHFRTGSDAEVLVHLYEEHGDDFVTRLEGMFAFGLWDRVRGRLLLGRDRLGIKPLYYAQIGDRLAFASESKAIALRSDYVPAIDPLALEQFLALGYVPQPWSLFAGISKLPPACLMRVEDGRLSIYKYWAFEIAPDTSRSEVDWIRDIRARLAASVEAQLVSDVPLGAFLSGGIDSSAIVASMSALGGPRVRTYAIGYAGSTGAELYNELDHARRIANHFGTEHHEILVQPQVVGLLPRLVWHMDEPTADSALVTSSLVSEFARRDVKVILSGVGGDELFGGYDRYRLPHAIGLLGRVPAGLRRGFLNPLLRRLPVARHSRLLNLFRALRKVALAADLPPTERYHEILAVFSCTELEAVLRAPVSGQATALAAVLGQHRDANELDMAMAADLATQLTDDLLLLTDKVSMAHSLECRVPLLDERLLDLAARLPAGLRVRGGTTRYILRKALAGLLPAQTLRRSKRGFGAPFGAWLTRELSGVTGELLNPITVERRGLLNASAVSRIVAEHRSNRADHTDHLTTMITLEIWCRLFLDRETPEDLAGRLGEQAGSAV